ncbi:MAG: histidinol-phosphate aminotransferase family protein [archaeon]|nr:histidinol-phosphate aminotransferase family protein [archaeon]
MQIEPRKELADLPPTVHGGQGWRLAGIEDYSQNLNPMGPPEILGEIVAKSVADAGHYPDASCLGVREKLAKYYGIAPENICMGAGSSEIIRNFPHVFIRPGDSVLLPTPSFAEYTQQCRIAGAQIDYLPLRAENDFHIDVDELFKILESKHYAAMYICNPNNPTGRVESREKIMKIVSRCEELGTMVFLDETLLALVAEVSSVSMIKYVGQFTNLIIAESYTKSFAIPGMRIGYAISNPDIIREMEKVNLPWNVGTVEQTVAAHLTEYEMDHPLEAALDMRKESKVMHSQLEIIGFPVGPVSDSFFYFVDLAPIGLTGASFKDRMLKEGFMVRDCASFGPQYESFVRFCVKDRERNERFVKAVENVLASLGL